MAQTLNTGAQKTLADLVAINSVSARSNRAVIDYVRPRVEALGMNVRLFTYTDERGVEKINMVATSAAADQTIELALVGHTDTVPFDPLWDEAILLTERDGKLYGRGACDTKGFIAATLAAVEEVGVVNLRRPLALILTADEEVGCLGAKRLAEERPLRARYAVVGEPTSLRPMRAGKGYCLAEIIVRGREGHSAYPALGASAIFRAARLLGRIERVADRLQDEQHAAFDPPYTTLNVGLISGGSAKNIIPGECRLTLEWRPVPGQQTDRVVTLIQNEIADLRERDADFAAEIEVIRLDGGTETPAASPLVLFLEEATGQAAGTVAFGTEAPQMAELGAEAVVFGPGDIRVAHRTGEYVPLAELEECVRVLSQTVRRFCL
ncbi:MAG TPA: acetylornithine deacetylase [Pyrinomonadaceae bacterium]|nr:acetylornithine deacetylase [Pyrinomonadaceae bacterium]